MNDYIGQANLYGGLNANLTLDRFNKPYSAIGLYQGYYQLPDYYFNYTQFTVMAWVKLRSQKYYQRLIEFGNGADMDNIFFALNSGSTYFPSFSVYKGSNYQDESISNTSLIIDQWTHIAFVLDINFGYIFMNGTQTSFSSNVLSPNFISRVSNYVGRSNFRLTAGDSDTDADIDELKICNKVLTSDQIKFEMNNDLFL